MSILGSVFVIILAIILEFFIIYLSEIERFRGKNGDIITFANIVIIPIIVIEVITVILLL